MSSHGSESSSANRETFRDCLLAAVAAGLAGPAKSNAKRSTRRSRRKSTGTPSRAQVTDDDQRHHLPASPDGLDGLDDFASFLAEEIFDSLPGSLQDLSHHHYYSTTRTPGLSTTYALPLSQASLEHLIAPVPPAVTDSLTAYGLISPPSSDLTTFLSPVLAAYIAHQTASPPSPASTRPAAGECEICARDWLPLTYHHLIPRSTHAKALKRNWHDERLLNSVAWLCRACHSFVHGMAGNEELAREWFTVERILERGDVRRWVGWVGRVRWKKG